MALEERIVDRDDVDGKLSMKPITMPTPAATPPQTPRLQPANVVVPSVISNATPPATTPKSITSQIENTTTISTNKNLSTSTKIGITGMSLRLGQQVNNLAAFRDLLISPDRNLTVKVPFGEKIERNAAFLDREDLYKFDNKYFKISPREAGEMDPQQKWLLECVVEALGVFIGATAASEFFSSTFKPNSQSSDNYIGRYTSTGTQSSIFSNRISYIFNLHGPSITVDTACSSSMTALHLAMNSIQLGECDVAIVGGTSLLSGSRETVGGGFLAFEAMGMLASDGRCKPFDTSADGFGRCEGCAVVVLRKVEQSGGYNGPVYSIVLASGVNEDGKTSSLTKPSAEAQSCLMREVLERGGVEPGSVGFVEAHGTGTQTGDPIEVSSISEVFRPGTAGGNKIRIGSVKGHVGHGECMSGLLGIIKASLMLSLKELYPTSG
ncbi:hypothetical protein HDU76_009962, partial [Blyttiomyces sp. JEL0837]